MDVLEPYYQVLIDHYEQCFEQYGAVSKGVDWPNARDVETRFRVMLDICADSKSDVPIKLLDLGCGYGALLDYLNLSGSANKFQYRGIDLSSKMIAEAIRRHGHDYFEKRNVLIDKLPAASFDYIIMNGVFTEKRDLTQEQMELYFIELIKNAYDTCRIGIAFNVMNFHVDWYRDDLFYLPFDKMSSIIMKQLGRHINIRADYGLYEYTVYVYKQPNAQ